MTRQALQHTVNDRTVTNTETYQLRILKIHNDRMKPNLCIEVYDAGDQLYYRRHLSCSTSLNIIVTLSWVIQFKSKSVAEKCRKL